MTLNSLGVKMVSEDEEFKERFWPVIWPGVTEEEVAELRGIFGDVEPMQAEEMNVEESGLRQPCVLDMGNIQTFSYFKE